MRGLILAIRLAVRDLRGFSRAPGGGFTICALCLALGVGAIAGVQSTAAAVRAGLAAEAKIALGGDFNLALTHEPPTPAQMTALAEAGRISMTTRLRAMAHDEQDNRRHLVELKAVDRAYPLYGDLAFDRDLPRETLLGKIDDVWGAAADPALLDDLGIRPGDKIRLGEAGFEIRARIRTEPDRGIAPSIFGPRVLIDDGALAATGLVRPGSLIRYDVHLKLAPGIDADSWRVAIGRRFSDAWWRVQGPEDASASIGYFLDRLTQFLTFVGLAALVIGGIGMANGVRAYLRARLRTIAAMKCLGGTQRIVAGVFALEISAITALAVAGGALAGAALPWALADSGAAFSLPVRPGIYPGALALAVSFGLAAAFAFATGPLLRALAVSPARLFRSAHFLDDIVPSDDRAQANGAGIRARVGSLLAFVPLAACTIASAADARQAAGFVAGALAVFLIFRALARAIEWGAERVRPHRPGLRLALANLCRPGSATAPVVASIGLALTVLGAIGEIQANLDREISQSMPQRAPAFFFIDIAPDQIAAFADLVRRMPGVAHLETVANLRGRLVRIGEIPVDAAKIDPSVGWIARGDRGLTELAMPPEDAEIVAGDWWAQDYQGAPLVSFDAAAAAGMGVKIGDMLTVNVLGREITARVANLRRIAWRSLALNYIFIFSPGTLAGAPLTYVATVRLGSGGDGAQQAALERAVTARFANISAIRVRDALASVSVVLEKIAVALRATAALVLSAGLLVMAGAMAAGQRRRIYDAVLFKVLGARRRTILASILVEYALLGALAAFLAAAVATAVAYAVVTGPLATPWRFAPVPIAVLPIAGPLVTLAGALWSTRRALGRKAAPYLRNE